MVTDGIMAIKLLWQSQNFRRPSWHLYPPQWQLPEWFSKSWSPMGPSLQITQPITWSAAWNHSYRRWHNDYFYNFNDNCYFAAITGIWGSCIWKLGEVVTDFLLSRKIKYSLTFLLRWHLQLPKVEIFHEPVQGFRLVTGFRATIGKILVANDDAYMQDKLTILAKLRQQRCFQSCDVDNHAWF